ncbi:hypothetical protein K474DRAFT_1098482 [Panus rudis PR-1116 ss-1]|nr:hypothetical protein K474DRAFT_1098482 [Panus rudis PR-1116 ss-1]
MVTGLCYKTPTWCVFSPFISTTSFDIRQDRLSRQEFIVKAFKAVKARRTTPTQSTPPFIPMPSQKRAGCPDIVLMAPPSKRSSSVLYCPPVPTLVGLPDELLILIFHFAGRVSDRTDPLVCLSLVCRRLRAVAMSTSSLWKEVCTSYLDCALEFAKRAQDHPFQAYLSVLPSGGHNSPTPSSVSGVLRREEFANLSLLYLLTTVELMGEMLQTFPNKLPALTALTLVVKHDSLRSADYPPLPVLDLSSTGSTPIWNLRKLNLGNVQFRYRDNCRGCLPYLENFHISQTDEYASPWANPVDFRMDDFLNLVDDCPRLRMIFLGHPWLDTDTTSRSLSNLAQAPALKEFNFGAGANCRIVKHVSFPESTRVHVFADHDEATIPPFTTLFPALKVDTLEFLFNPRDGHRTFRCMAFQGIASMIMRPPITMSWEGADPAMWPLHVESIFKEFPSVRNLCVRQTDDVDTETWTAIMHNALNLRRFSVAYFPDRFTSDAPPSCARPLETLLDLAVKRKRCPSELIRVDITGFPTRLPDYARTFKAIDGLLKEKINLRRLGVVQRSEEESSLDPYVWTFLGRTVGIKVKRSFLNELPLHVYRPY